MERNAITSTRKEINHQHQEGNTVINTRKETLSSGLGGKYNHQDQEGIQLSRPGRNTVINNTRKEIQSLEPGRNTVINNTRKAYRSQDQEGMQSFKARRAQQQDWVMLYLWAHGQCLLYSPETPEHGIVLSTSKLGFLTSV